MGSIYLGMCGVLNVNQYESLLIEETKAMAVCSISSNSPVMINVTTQYDLLPPTVGNGQQSKLLTLDPTTKASLWWGASLM